MDKSIYLLIILIIIFILFLIVFNYNFLNKVECFSTEVGELSQYSKEHILEDCSNSWAKIYNSLKSDCETNAWITNPKLLSGICGESEKNPLYAYNTLNKNSPRLYGCAENTPNSIGLSWKRYGNNIVPKVPPLLGSKQTSNLNNINATSGMYIYACCDDYFTISLNGGVIINHSGWNDMGVYYIPSIKYGDKMVLAGKNMCAPGGISISYIWNKELYILDNNDFENSANIINYTTSGNFGWSKLWSDGKYVNKLLPWMKNWIWLKYVNCSGEQSYGSISFKIGDTKNQGSLNNDLNVFLGVDDTATVFLNYYTVYQKKQPWNVVNNFVIPNVNVNDILTINCINSGGPSAIGITYLWGGQIYTLPSTLSNFNSVVNILNYTTINTFGLNNQIVSSIENNLQFVTDWIKGPDTPDSFSLTTKIGQSGYAYSLASGIWYTPTMSNNIGTWASLGINSNTSMTISFMIKITAYNGQWRSIIHITNTGRDCCSIGDRVPAIWVTCCSQTTLHICNSTPLNGNEYFYSQSIALNTPTQVDIQWGGNYIYVYYDEKLVNTYYHRAIPVAASPNATVYLGDPWYTGGQSGYQIKDFIIKNS